MLKCIELDERLKAMDQEITVNPQFVQKVIDFVSCKRFSAVCLALNDSIYSVNYILLIICMCINIML